MKHKKPPPSRLAHARLQEELKQPRSPQQIPELISAVTEDLTTRETRAFHDLVDQNSTLKPLKMKWLGELPYKTLICTGADPHPIAMAQALYPRSYFCFESALYLLGEIENIPNRIHVAKERSNPLPSSQFELTDKLLLEQFSKQPRHTSRIAKYNERDYLLLEREYAQNLGVVTKWKKIEGQTRELMVTDLERILLDASMSPHNAGGTPGLCKLIKRIAPKVDLEVLHSRYLSFNWKYPYWQRIGFLLETVDRKKANAWMKLFGSPKYKFFLDKGFSKTWDFDQKWQLYYPKMEIP